MAASLGSRLRQVLGLGAVVAGMLLVLWWTCLGAPARAGSEEEEAAYDAPFPDLIYMSGVRVFPSLINTLGEYPTNIGARLVFNEFEKPLLTLFGRLDQNMGSEAVQAELRDTVPGAQGQPHHAYPDAAHFIQEDKGEDLAWRVVDFIGANPLP